jgi:hypothetical protein
MSFENKTTERGEKLIWLDRRRRSSQGDARAE